MFYLNSGFSEKQLKYSIKPYFNFLFFSVFSEHLMIICWTILLLFWILYL